MHKRFTTLCCGFIAHYAAGIVLRDISFSRGCSVKHTCGVIQSSEKHKNRRCFPQGERLLFFIAGFGSDILSCPYSPPLHGEGREQDALLFREKVSF
jgi:hypothetical protein